MTTISYVAFIIIGAWPVASLSLCSANLHFVMFFISHSWCNKDLQTIASICLYSSHSGSTATADPPYAKQ